MRPVAQLFRSGCLAVFAASGCASQGSDRWVSDSPGGQSLASIGAQCSARTGPDSTIEFQLHNDSPLPIQLLKWDTPWDNKTDLLRFADGATPTYLGLRPLGRPEPDESQFLEVPAGETLTVTVVPGELYRLEPNRAYDVSLRSSIWRVRRGDELLDLEHACGHGFVTASSTSADLGVVQQELGTYGCNENQRSQINLVNDLVYRAADAARVQVSNRNAKYREWFGEWGGWKGDEVRAHYQLMVDSTWSAYDVRCGGASCCDGGANGCYISVLDRIYVCDRWYDLKLFGVNQQTRVGTLLHELTHAASGGTHPNSTDDIVDQGQCGGSCITADQARSLALDPTCDNGSNECKAIRNAANYNYFATDVLMKKLTLLTAL